MLNNIMSILKKKLLILGDKYHEPKEAMVLFDSGATSSVISKELAESITPLFERNPQLMHTAGNDIIINKMAIAGFVLSDKCTVSHGFKVVDKVQEYDMIVGVDIMQNKKIILNFKDDTIDTSNCSEDSLI